MGGAYELSEAAQQWFTVLLIWVGFGTLAGLLAKALLPTREPSNAAAVVAIGIVGSLIGPLAISCLWHGHAPNPIGPFHLLAATGCALVLMILYRLAIRSTDRTSDSSEN